MRATRTILRLNTSKTIKTRFNFTPRTVFSERRVHSMAKQVAGYNVPIELPEALTGEQLQTFKPFNVSVSP
jgi:hypothetical protein